MAAPPSSSSSTITTISPATRLRWDLYAPRNIDNINENDEAPPLVVSVLASLFERIISKNTYPTTILASPHRNSAFHSQSIIDLSISSFLHRIYRYTHPSSSIFVVAYAYLDRLRHVLPLHPSNMQLLILTVIMLASKFLQDVNYSNSHYARIGGVKTEKMNEMEMELLFLMGFRLHVNVRVFESYCSHLEREVSFGGGYQIERTILRCISSSMLHESSKSTKEGS